MKASLTAFVATASAFTDNILGTNVASRIANSGAIPSNQQKNWNTAVTTTHYASIFFGLGESTLGGGLAEGAGATTLLTGGLSSEVTLPAVALGGAMVLHGGIVVNNASRNLASGNGLIKGEGGSYNSSSQPKYKKAKSGISGKEGAKDVPDWAKGEKPFVNENGNLLPKDC